MKPCIFTLQPDGFTLNRAIEKQNSYLKTYTLNVIFLLYSIFSFGNPGHLPAGAVTNLNADVQHRPLHSPLTGTESIRSTLYLVNANNTLTLADGVYTEYNNLYHDGVMMEDAYKFTNILENLGLLRYGAVLAVERRPLIDDTDTLYFKLWKTTRRNYQFEFVTTNLEHPGMQAMLNDSYLGTTTPVALNGVTKVRFNVNADPASANVNRFKIVYQTNISFTPLPVTFTSLKAHATAYRISVEWKVENESNIRHYEIERSINGIDFKPVKIMPVSATTSGRNGYNWYDDARITGNSFYRIKSVDLDGSGKFSVIVKVATGIVRPGTITVYPNPIQGNTINLQFKNQPTGVYEIQIISTSGQYIYQGNLALTDGNTTYTINTSKKLAIGIYQLQIKLPNNSMCLVKAIVQ